MAAAQEKADVGRINAWRTRRLEFTSKLAYTVLLLALSRAPSAPGTVVSIPAH
jgi:hypothetical protein